MSIAMRPAVLSLIFITVLADVEPKESKSVKPTSPQASQASQASQSTGSLGSWTATLPVAKFVGEGNASHSKAAANKAALLAVGTKSETFLAQSNVSVKAQTTISTLTTMAPKVKQNGTENLKVRNLSPNLQSPVPVAPVAPVVPVVPASINASPTLLRADAEKVTEDKVKLPQTDKVLEGVSPYGPQWHSWHFWKIWPQLGALEKLLAGITFMSMLKACCMAGNILVQISPYPQVQRWEANGCTGDSDAAPYVSIAFGGWQWCYYGLFAFFVTKRSGFLILVHSNCLGAVLGTYYSIAFYRNCNHHSLGGLQRYSSAVVMLVLFQLCSLAVLPVERALFVTGLISSFCSFIGAISILVSLPRVIRTQDSSSIPALLVLANLISSLVWCICGWMLEDPLIAAPNVVGFLSGSICLFLKQWYPDHDYTLAKRPVREVTHPLVTPPPTASPRPERSVWKMPISYQSCDTGGTD